MFDFDTTSEAVEFVELVHRINMDNISYWQVLDPVVNYMQGLYKAADEAVEAWNDGDVYFWHDFVDKVLPVWKNQVVHDASLLTVRYPTAVNSLMYPYHVFTIRTATHVKDYNSSTLLTLVETMFKNAYELQVTDEVFREWCSRISRWLLYFNNATYCSPVVWQDEYDVEVLRKFKADRWFSDRSKILNAVINHGFDADLVYKYGVDITQYVTAGELVRLSVLATPKLVKDIVKLNAQGREPLTSGIIFNLVEVGFVSGKEIKDYARKFGVGWNDSNFFARLINAKRLYPVLDSYIPAV